MNYSDDQEEENCSEPKEKKIIIVLVGVMYISYTTSLERAIRVFFHLVFCFVLQTFD